MASLYEECIEALGNNVSILKDEDSQNLKNKFFELYKFEFGGIDWSQYKNYNEIVDLSKVLNVLSPDDCFIIWDEFDLPVIESSLNIVVNNIDDVTAVSFDTWLVSKNFNWLIEIHHEGMIRVLGSPTG